jgi:glutamyl-tRNA reductase
VLLCITANHRNSSFEVLEKLAACEPGAISTRMTESSEVSGAVVVSTCNRFEAYLEVDADAGAGAAAEALLEILSDSSGVERGELESTVRILRDDEVVPHLFAVSAGLKSVVVGEDEIAGQVRRSLERARSNGTTTASLERLFQNASRTSKSVKSRTAVGRADRSLVRLALELAASRIADWSTTSVLLIGTGRYAATTVAALRDRGARDITVYSPSGRAAAFALKRELQVASELAVAISDADIVIGCTSREAPVVTPTVVSAGRRRLVIDLGLPRNVSPDVAGIPGIELLDLETIRLHAPLEELQATRAAHDVVDSAVSRFSDEEAERRAADSVIALRRHVLELLDRELERSKRRGTWTPEGEAELRHFAGVLLHTPTLRARELERSGDGSHFAAGLSAVFGIEAGSA